MIQYVIKRDGRKEPFNTDKINDWARWGEKTVHPKDFSWSGIVMRVVGSMPEEVTAQELQDALIRECLNQDTWEGSRMAGRLYASSLPKVLYEGRKHPHIKDLHAKLIDAGIVVKPNYTDEEYDLINKMLVHRRDYTYPHYAVNQLVKKYALQDRVNRRAYETPQFIYMRVAMQTFNHYEKPDRMEKLKGLYEELSHQRINVPTPYFANSLTSNTNTCSCSVITCQDEWQSIGVLNTLAYSLTTIGAGVGAHMKTRSINDPVRGGLVKHAGKVPYYRAFANVMKSSTQGCYDPETKVLTANGWIPFESVTKDTQIVQVAEDMSLSTSTPTDIIAYKHKGVMYHFTSDDVDVLVTPDHRMIYTRDGKLQEEIAETVEFKEGDILHLDIDSQVDATTVRKDKVEDYDAMVYCVTVPTNIILVMRNHKTLVCGNSRSGASTMHFPVFDPEIEVLIGLKNPLSTLANRVRESDYAVSINKPFLKRAFTKKPFWLFSYKDNPELYEMFYHADSEAFDRELEAYAMANPEKVTEIDANHLLSEIMRHRVETGRLYIHFADISNHQTPYFDSIYSSNLCLEVLEPTKPFSSHQDLYSEDPEGLVAFCNLAGLNIPHIKNDEEYERAAYYALTMIEHGIENSTPPFPALNANLKDWRSAGVGIVGLAYLMAKKGMSYTTQEGREFIHEQAERYGYFVTKAAIQLTKEYGTCKKAGETKYANGWLPMDDASPAAKALVNRELAYDWDALREEMKALGGLRFSTLMAIAPSESCLGVETKVHTSDGLLSLKDILETYAGISLDDATTNHNPIEGGFWCELKTPLKALTRDGSYQDIPRVWVNGVTVPFKITLEDGSVVKATANHKFLVKRDIQEVWVSAKELKEGDDIVEMSV